MKRKEEPQIFVGRRFSEFVELHRRLRMEMPGKVLHPLPRKNRSVSLLSRAANDDEEDEDEDDDDDEDDKVSMSSTSTHEKAISLDDNNLKPVLPSTTSHFRKSSANSFRTTKPKRSFEASSPRIILYQEEQRVSLRAFLRTVLQNEHIAKSEAMTDFLTARPVKLNEEEQLDIRARHDMDERRLEEQKLFYEIARRRARELDIHMEKFRRDVIERSTQLSSSVGK